MGNIAAIDELRSFQVESREARKPEGFSTFGSKLFLILKVQVNKKKPYQVQQVQFVILKYNSGDKFK